MTSVNRLKTTALILTAVFTAKLLYHPTPGFAKQYSSLQISPLVIEANLVPGEEKLVSIKYFNPVHEPQTVRLQVKDALPRDDSGGLRFLDYSSPQYSLSRWIDFEHRPLTLAAHEEREIFYTIRVPTAARPGSHFGAIFGTVENEPLEQEKSPFSIRQHVAAGTLLLINVPGEVLGEEKDWGGYLESFEVKTGGPLNLAQPPIKIITRFKNTGIFCQTVWGGVDITNSSGKVVGRMHLDEKRVLPEAATQLSTTWRKPFLLGKYTARLTLLYGKQGNRREQVQLAFWAISKEVLVMGGAIILGATLLILKTKGKLKHPSLV